MTSGKVVRIGLCTDLSGPYENVDGHGGAEAIRMAIEDAVEANPDLRVELLLGDHRNDVGAAHGIALQWCEDGVDMIVSGVNSDTSLALTEVAAANGTPVFVVGAGTSVQTRERASFTIIQYAYSTVGLATVPGLALTRRGSKRWFFVTADYPFGNELQEHGTEAIRSAGGVVVGAVRNPHGAEDFVPYLRAALESGAEVLGLANGHAELLKAMSAMDRLGVVGRMQLVGLLTFVDDIHEMGLDRARGLYLADSWFWTRDARSRTWAERFFARRQRMPSSLQAADYSAALQYLLAVSALGSADPEPILAYLRRVVLDDMYVRNGRIREDGMMLHDMYLLQVKTPEASAQPWDYYELIETVPGDEAFPMQTEPKR